jgi:hypothetical protein
VAAFSFSFAERPPFTSQECIRLPAKTRSGFGGGDFASFFREKAKSFRIPPAGFGLGPAPRYLGNT